MYIPFERTFENWWESHSLRSELSWVRRQHRVFRRLPGLFNHIKEKTKDLEKVFETKPVIHEEVDKALKRYAKECLHAIDQLQFEARGYKVILNKHLNRLEDLESATVSVNNTQAVPEIREFIKEFEESANSFFQKLTSFHSINLSTMRLLDLSSQAREGFYGIKKARKLDKKEKSQVEKVIKDLRNGNFSDKDEEILKKAVEETKQVLKEEMHAVGIALLVMQELLREFDRRKQQIMDMARPKAEGGRGYPWAEQNAKIIDMLGDTINEWVDREIAEGRLFLANVKHKAESERLSA